MSINRNTVVFFDASCLIAAAGSPQGGSGFILSVCTRQFLKGACSQPVLLEAERNILAKLSEDALNNYHRLLVLTPLIIVPVPTKNERQALRGMVEEKDEHVVAAALAVNAPFLLTLDKNLEEDVNHADLLIRAYAPGDFIKTILTSHADYPEMRE